MIFLISVIGFLCFQSVCVFCFFTSFASHHHHHHPSLYLIMIFLISVQSVTLWTISCTGWIAFAAARIRAYLCFLSALMRLCWQGENSPQSRIFAHIRTMQITLTLHVHTRTYARIRTHMYLHPCGFFVKYQVIQYDIFNFFLTFSFFFLSSSKISS